MYSKVDSNMWRDFVKEYISFCLKIALKIPKSQEKKYFLFPQKHDFNDFPINSCLRDDSYERLKNLTQSEFEGVSPVELIACAEIMVETETPRDFEIWLNANYNEWHTPSKIF